MGVEYYSLKPGQRVVVRAGDDRYLVLQVEHPQDEEPDDEDVKDSPPTSSPPDPIHVIFNPGAPPDALKVAFDEHFLHLSEPRKLEQHEIRVGTVAHAIDLVGKQP